MRGVGAEQGVAGTPKSLEEGVVRLFVKKLEIWGLML